MEESQRSDLVGQRKVRLEKIEKLKKLGINAYPAKSNREYEIGKVLNEFDSFDGKQVCLAGRVMAWRTHGKLLFLDIKDQTGTIQVMVKKDSLEGDLKKEYLDWDNLELLDLADFVEVVGEIGKSKTGQISIFTKKIRLLTKSLRPIPRKLNSKEQIFRRRYLDLIINEDRVRMFERKAKFWEVQREFLKKEGFIEVEVPILEPVTGGADAKPFITHHNALDQDFFLRISTELYQKRLIGGGYEKVYTLGPNFRNEGMDDEHLQEYYQLEWYWAYANFRDNMDLVKRIFLEIAEKVYGNTKFTTRGHTFDLADDWKEIDYTQVIKDTFDVDIFNDSDEKILEVVKKNNIELDGDINRNRLIDNLWKVIRAGISGPAFLINQPKFISPLAKSHAENPELTERFQVIIAGSELGNGYSEINDPVDQLERFLEQQDLRDSGDDEAQMLDIDFVEMLEYGMPPTSGYGQSERIFWFLEDVSGREGTFFPQMRVEIDSTTKKVYKEKLAKYLTPKKKVVSKK
ncbi:lysine--tRNA ligase [Candidatus Dojkabacteria bacterium HGW-Dojkabacteria-1]|uniref:Lysine--tRNA ligase n=1 Tax=Candidatus Dojkabacteria bacterium HGW-Dojkabacteria-1 TaxID=2013761 RepID=A0A2N2F356_9BACT|nr:MAG: lysine--tRNA ligase [Candidatus Dojkabacteria bacterium HGW-Dojkabacteria-1]